MSKMDEEIIAVKRTKLFGHSDEYAFSGFLSYDKNFELSELLLNRLFKDNELGRRGDYEEDPSYKQPIPYVVLMTDGPNGLEVYTYERLKGGGEARLHNKLSIGVGGHMNLLYDYPTLYDEAVRELDEELHIDVNTCRYRVVGMINDDSSDVSRVHIGILITAKVPPTLAKEIHVREEDQLRGEWINIEKLREVSMASRLESWSAIALDYLISNYALK